MCVGVVRLYSYALVTHPCFIMNLCNYRPLVKTSPADFIYSSIGDPVVELRDWRRKVVWIIYYLHHRRWMDGGYVFYRVCLFVYPSVIRISQKVMDGFRRNLVDGLGVEQG